MSEVKRMVIFYFSGTGNAKQIALWVAGFAQKKQIDCRAFSIEKTDINDVKALCNDALIAIVSPIHGFNFPKSALDFISLFPKGNNNVVLMNTRGGLKIGSLVTPGLTGVAFYLSSYILMCKDYKIVGHIPFDMPSNWISIHPALNQPTVKYLYEKNYSRVEKHCNKILEGKADFYSNREIIQDVLISPVSLGYYFAGKYFFAKSFYASEECDNCGMCIKQCPVKAIKIVNDRPFWTSRCESCMRCMNSCPKKAIETAHGLIATISVMSSLILSWLLGNVLAINIQSGFIRFSFFSVIFFTLLWIFYKLQHLLLRNKFIGKLIPYASLTHYKFWGRYKNATWHSK